MKIDNIVIKIYSKFKNLLLNKFGNTEKANIFIKFMIAGILSSQFYYYIADHGFSNILTFCLLTVGFYIVISVLVPIIKIAVTIFKRMGTKNIILFSLLYAVLYFVIDELSYDAFLDDWHIYMFPLIIAAVIFILFKSFIAVVLNKKKLPILLLVPSIVLIGFSVFTLLFFNKSSTDSAMKIAETGTKKLDGNINYSAASYEYGQDLKDTVSLMKYVNYSGTTKKIRDKYFGRSLGAVPIKGKVWYPENKENSPVLFITHGNHRFTEQNYLGYDYLGKYLARRGIIVVSVDMNMLNGFLKYGVGKENDARAILLLENIKYILKENKDSKSEHYNLIDESQVAIAGHSRGGEAVVAAQNFNVLEYNPDNGDKLDYNFNIKAVASIAPTEGQYNPSNKDLAMKDVNFFTIHGSHDKDVEGFDGMVLYNNVKFSEGSNNFKSAVYVGYANHGQFNEKWGSADADPPYSLFVNTPALISEESQQEIICEYMYSFLANSFGFINDRGLFKNPYKYAMPKTFYYSRYSDDTFESICDFEEDYDLTTFKYGTSKFNGFNSLYESDKKIGNSSSDTCLNLRYSGSGDYELLFDKAPKVKKYLQVDIANEEKLELYNKVNFKIRLTDKYGNESEVNISDYITLYPKVKVEKSKLQFISNEYDYNGSYQTLRIPISDFKTKSKINLNEIRYLNFIFKGESGKISIDNIGFSD
ncbi:alpha/beta hydrolase [Peptoniphilus mikwangii]|uniref:hypothetical protein n=1 Tax=Peptoniphilus mikwangii TaxID=1354300 RepID=UPI0004064560|nr:hypothetical protein [Peptoniphilus mikwangii]